jgi:predicted dehydrogenase
MKKLKVGIIGSGTMSKLHLDSYRCNPFVEVTALCDTNIKRLGEKALEWQIPNTYESTEMMFRDEEIDAVSIVTPTCTHAPIAIAALKAGKHVLCEKPPAINALEAAEMEKTARECEKLLMFGFCFRFIDKVEVLQEFIKEGMLGNIYYAKAGWLRRYGNPGGWFTDRKISGGGPMMDIGIHILDLAICVMGKPKPVSVYGVTYKNPGDKVNIRGKSCYRAADAESGISDIEDLASALIRFDNGASLFIESSFTANIKSDIKYIEFFGDKAGAKLEPGLEIFGEKHNYLIDIKPAIDNYDIDWERSINREVNHFVDCLVNGVPCISPAVDAIAVMKIIDAIYKSSETGTLITLL